MAIAFPPFPIPIVTPLGDGYVVYVETNPTWENDSITVALCDGGQWRHFNSGDIKSFHNSTYGIQKQQHGDTTNP